MTVAVVGCTTCCDMLSAKTLASKQPNERYHADACKLSLSRGGGMVVQHLSSSFDSGLVARVGHGDAARLRAGRCVCVCLFMSRVEDLPLECGTFNQFLESCCEVDWYCLFDVKSWASDLGMLAAKRCVCHW
jgi:hypothetical protein